MELSQDGHEDMQAAAEMGGEDRVTADPDVEGPIAGLFEAVRGISVGGVDRDSVAAVLESKRHVDDKPLRTSNAQIRVDDGHIGAIETWHCGLMY